MGPIPFSEAHIDRNRNSVTLCIARQKSLEVLEQLLKAARSQDQNFMNVEDGFGLTPLWTAIHCDNPKCLPLLVQYGASLEQRNQAGLTPLTEATSNETCHALLQCGADIDAFDKNGRSVLHSAVYRCNFDLIRLLLDRNATIDAHTVKNLVSDPKVLEIVLERPRRLASGPLLATLLKVERNPPRELLEYLVKSGAEVNAHDQRGYSALHIAVRRGDHALVELLLECGADINCRTFVNAFGHGGCAALHLAVLKGNGALVDLLLKRGADINCKTLDGRTALSIAGQRDDSEMIGVLLDRGANYSMLTPEQREAVFRHDPDHPPS
jgi:ankyrin repeat protein